MKRAAKRSPKRPHVHVKIRDRARWLLKDPLVIRRAHEVMKKNISDGMREHLLNGGPPLTLEELLREATRTQRVLLERGSRLEIFLTVAAVESKPGKAVQIRRRQ